MARQLSPASRSHPPQVRRACLVRPVSGGGSVAAGQTSWLQWRVIIIHLLSKGISVASRTITRLMDDISGKEIAEGQGETITFSIDGVTHEIDLDAKSAAKMRETFQFYVDHGRRVGGRRSTGGAPSAARSGGRTATNRDPRQAKAIREWAKTNGVTVSERGRISSSVVAAYEAAH